MEYERLDELEKKIRKLIESYNNLKEENEKSKNELIGAKQQIAALEEKFRIEETKRRDALSRVDELINLLEPVAGETSS